jgi:U3 small nucleolar RNA-associated protein 22
MSYRYFHKRTHYLAVIMASLRELAGKEKAGLRGVDLGWGCTGGDVRRSAIILTAGKGWLASAATGLRF